jgi:DNA-binding response OmpR family regulator
MQTPEEIPDPKIGAKLPESQLLANYLPAGDTSSFGREKTSFITIGCSDKPAISHKALIEKILIVGDDQTIQEELWQLFESAGYAVEITGDGKSALDVFRRSVPTAIVLDFRLPLLSGRDICLQVKRERSEVPIIIVSESKDVVDKVVLLEMGVDYYINKPFSARELLACVRSAIRSARKPTAHDEARFNGVCVDFTTMEITRDGKPVPITPREFKILKYFLRNANRDISRDELLSEALGYRDSSSMRSIDNHILKLRHKLERDPENPAHFLTAYGAGYRFVR